MLIINISLVTRAMDQQEQDFRFGPLTPNINQKVLRAKEILRNNSKENPENLALAIGLFEEVLSMKQDVNGTARLKIEAMKKKLEAKKAEVLEQLNGFEIVDPREEQEPGSPQSFGRITLIEHFKLEEKKE